MAISSVVLPINQSPGRCLSVKNIGGDFKADQTPSVTTKLKVACSVDKEVEEKCLAGKLYIKK